MKLEDQVVSFELAKKLKELGLPQEDSLHRWQYLDSHNMWEVTSLRKSYIEKYNNNPENYSAFTIAELIDMWPTDKEDLHFNFCKSSKNGFFITYKGFTEEVWAKSIADSLAEQIICLIENKLWEL